MNIDSIKNGIVIDHITAGRSMQIYRLLGLDALECSVALIKNVNSHKMGKKDIIKIDTEYEVDTAILGFVDPNATISVIKDSKIVEKRTLSLPEKLHGVLRCKNPRCITSTEQELPHIFTLTDKDSGTYRCLYCETKAEKVK